MKAACAVRMSFIYFLVHKSRLMKIDNINKLASRNTAHTQWPCFPFIMPLKSKDRVHNNEIFGR